ncbi:hypothetical protein Droror1_Dr00005513, partial [Drosera rotundifolia]
MLFFLVELGHPFGVVGLFWLKILLGRAELADMIDPLLQHLVEQPPPGPGRWSSGRRQESPTQLKEAENKSRRRWQGAGAVDRVVACGALKHPATTPLAALLHLCSTTTLSGHLFDHLSLSLSPISDSFPFSSSTLPPSCPTCSFPLSFLA